MALNKEREHWGAPIAAKKHKRSGALAECEAMRLSRAARLPTPAASPDIRPVLPVNPGARHLRPPL